MNDEAAEFCAKYEPESDEVYQALVNASKQEMRELTRVLNESSSYGNRVKDTLLDIITRYRIAEYIRTTTEKTVIALDEGGTGTGPVLVSEANRG